MPVKRIFSLLLSAALLLGLCGCGGRTISFTWFVDALPTNLDPQVASASADVIACTHLYSGLFRQAADGTLQNACCASYTVSADGLTYTFALRSGMTYRQTAGGSAVAVTAQDFLFAFRRVFRAETASPYAASFLSIRNGAAVLAGTADESQLGVAAPDDSTLVITLAEKDDHFLEKLALPGAMPCNEAFFDSTKGSYGLSSATVLTNGSFYLLNWTSSGLFLRRDITDGHITNLRLVQNTSTAVQTPEELVLNGKCSAALDTTDTQTTLQTISYSDTTWCLVYNCAGVLGNASLRAALSADALQADLPQDSTLYSAAEGLVPDGVTVDGEDYRKTAGSALPALSAGTEAYQQALAEIGADNLKGLSILVPDTADAASIQALNGRWQKDYSLFFSLQTVSAADFAKAYEKGDYDIALVPLSLTQNDPLAILQPFASGGASGYANPAYDALLAQSAGAVGADKCALLAQAERLLLQDCAVTPLYRQNKRLLIDPAIHGLRFEPFGPVIDVTDAVHTD